MVDMVVVGNVVGEAGMSGLAIGGDLLVFLTFVSLGFSSAGQTIISQYIGAGEKDRLSRFIGTMSSFLMLCAVGMSVLCLLLRKHILQWMNTPAESWDQAMAYSVTCIFGLVFVYGYNIVGAVMRGMGDSKRPFVFIAVSAVINLGLDLLFVAVFRWEAFGAALATVIAQGTSFLSSVIYLYIRKDRFQFDFSLQSFRIDKNELKMLIRLGVPMALRSASTQFSKVFINAWINSFGVTVSAVAGIAQKFDTIFILLVNSVITAGSSMVGQNIGAGKYDRASKVLRSAFLLNGSCFLVVFLVLALFPQNVFRLFTDNEQVLEVCMQYLPAALVAIVGSAVRAPMNAFTSGCGNYKFNFAVAIMDGIVGRIGFSLLLGAALGLGYFGIWMGSSLAGFMPFILGGIYYLSGHWKKKSAIQ